MLRLLCGGCRSRLLGSSGLCRCCSCPSTWRCWSCAWLLVVYGHRGSCCVLVRGPLLLLLLLQLAQRCTVSIGKANALAHQVVLCGVSCGGVG
jgi:hypothetical protein